MIQLNIATRRSSDSYQATVTDRAGRTLATGEAGSRIAAERAARQRARRALGNGHRPYRGDIYFSAATT